MLKVIRNQSIKPKRTFHWSVSENPALRLLMAALLMATDVLPVFAESREKARNRYFETVIMDMDIREDKKQIKLLELAIQHGEEKRLITI